MVAQSLPDSLRAINPAVGRTSDDSQKDNRLGQAKGRTGVFAQRRCFIPV
jgi:hypothetical protein